MTKQMDMYTAVMIAEDVEESTEEQWLEAWQYLVNTGVVWRLQGWFGRMAQNLIDEGMIEEAGK